MEDLRYINDEVKFFDYSFSVLKQYFNDDLNDFKLFYNSLGSNEKKNKFLKIASFYKFLVVDGKFIVENDKSDPYLYIDYIDHTYKYIALFSFIENLYTTEEYKDFYSWLKSKETKIQFPINDQSVLNVLYKQYLNLHGSTQKAIRFLESLSDETKQSISGDFQIRKHGKTQSMPFFELAKLLYQIRSDFIHKANLVAHLNCGTTMHTVNSKLIEDNLNFEKIKMIFEEGFLSFFGYKKQ